MVRSMIPGRGESTDSEPEDSGWSTIEHSSSMELKGVKVSRAKWVEVRESGMPEVGIE